MRATVRGASEKINAHKITKVVAFETSAESTKVAVSLFGHTYRVYTKLNAIVKKY